MLGPSRTWPDSIGGYLIGEELGRGAFSVVCKATNVSTRIDHAVKIFPRARLTASSDIARFQQEVNTLAYLRHDNLVSLQAFLQDSSHIYLVLDLCRSGSLLDHLFEYERLDEPTAAIVFEQIVSAISYCHSCGVAHRDLKPENILITEFPNVKVADFGLCGFVSPDELMQTFCGSPCYCAPECLMRTLYDGRQSDVWSLGVVLFLMVTGEHPWTVTNSGAMLRQISEAAFSVPPDVSPLCRDLIQEMLRVDPTARISSARLLEHPWLRAGRRGAVVRHSPPMLKMRAISAASVKLARVTERGIASPFDEAGAPLVPEFVARAMSVNRDPLQQAPVLQSRLGLREMRRRRSQVVVRTLFPGFPGRQ